MSYKIESLNMRNFKCFDNKQFYKFSFSANANPTILSGPNGFGKTTFFDGVELIFTKKITRLEPKIEDQRTNLGKNILLNTSQECGYLVLTLSDEKNEVLTIIARIDKDLTKLTIESSVKYTLIEDRLNLDHFDEFLNDVIYWEEDIDKFDKLRYIKEHFSVYYYISQAESVHFLKRSISDRKNSVSKLLQTDAIKDKLDIITNQLTGKATTTKNVIINQEITRLKDEISNKISEIKAATAELYNSSEKIGYDKLLMYSEGAKEKEWDVETFVSNTVTQSNFQKYCKEIEGISSLYQNIKDFEISVENKNIKNLSQNSNLIANFIELYDFIEEKRFDIEKFNSFIQDLKSNIALFKYSDFFRNNLNIEKYNKENLLSLKKESKILLSFEIEQIETIIQQIKQYNSLLNDSQKKKESIVKARTELHEIINGDASKSCPYCNYEYQNSDLLEEAYINLTKTLEISQTSSEIEVKKLKNNLFDLLKTDIDLINKQISGLNSEMVKKFQNQVQRYEQLITSDKLISLLIEVKKYIKKDSWKNLDVDIQPIEIQSIIESNIKQYSNPNYEEDSLIYEYEQNYRANKEILSLPQPKLDIPELVKNKFKYIENVFSTGQNEKINKLKEQLTDLVRDRMKAEYLRNQYEALKKIYETSIKDYENSILKKLRVPLLIYTGKILQDYQNGLGVFINKDEMRFVSNGDAKHDILNTFSSGQLSGFVLAFLFAMNKQYIMPQIDDIGFILIDDPVQTMDDINISSFIEVLRNDFSDKQIILSTHETDKENYILYKFLKYNIRGTSFNVKDRMY